MAAVAGRSTGSLAVMNAKRREQLEARLAETESQLRALLQKLLPRVTHSGESAFFNSENLPKGYPPRIVPVEAEQSYRLASECRELSELLGQPIIGSVALLYLSACREAASDNQHRRGPRQLATWLLAEIERS